MKYHAAVRTGGTTHAWMLKKRVLNVKIRKLKE